MNKVETAVLASVLGCIWLALMWVPMTGVDQLAFSEQFGGGGLYVAWMGLSSMAALHAISDAISSPRLRPYARAGAFLLFIVGWMAAAWTEVGWMMGAYEPVLYDPGFRTQLLIVLTTAGAVSIAWVTATKLDEVGLDGAFILLIPQFLLTTAYHYGTGWFEPGAGVDVALRAPLWPAAAVCVALAIRPVRTPSSILGGWVVRTPLPFVLFPFAFGQVVSQLPGVPYTPWLETGAAWLGAGGVLAVVFSKGEATTLRWPWAVLAGLLATGASLAAVPLLARSAQQAMPRYAGSDEMVVEAAYERDVSERDLETLAERLSGASWSHRIERLDPRRVRFELVGVDAQAATPWLEKSGTQGGALSIHHVDPDFSYRRLGELAATASNRDDLTTYPPLPEPLLWGAEACPDRPGLCRLYALRPARLTGADIYEASVAFDYNGRPQVSVVFTSAGAKQFGELTNETVDEQIAIVLDDRVLSAPHVNEPILGGRVTIYMGSQDPAQLLKEAKDLAARLNTGALDAGRRTEFNVVNVVHGS